MVTEKRYIDSGKNTINDKKRLLGTKNGVKRTAWKRVDMKFRKLCSTRVGTRPA
jgi:hypothetical protein